MGEAPGRPVRVTIEGRDDPHHPWVVMITKPGDPFPRSRWDGYASHADAETGAKSARAYYRDTQRGVEGEAAVGSDQLTRNA